VSIVRFTKVVESAGRPGVHLLLTEPAKDSDLQKAIKANRVMTVHQEGKTDYGTIGFVEGFVGQILIFPKSLKEFADQRVTGINYDLLESAELLAPQPPKKEVPAKHPPARQPREVEEDSRKKPAAPPLKQKSVPAGRVIHFSEPKPADREEVNEEVKAIKDQVRQAMRALEEGKPVAAFNLLKRIVDQ
jgi:hypothetical protein